jgi:1-aminocyclopropane-1-carboxylate deaminase
LKTKNLLENPLFLALPNEKKAIIQFLDVINGVSVYIKREDLIHTFISGNKWRKLKYNLDLIKSSNVETLLTFGGAYSNHIFATAAAGKLYDIKTVGIIRGDEINDLNATLAFAKSCGMELRFVAREDYRLKHESSVIQKIISEYPSVYVIPEGGTNELALKGCAEILNEEDYNFYDYICCSCGTGGTLAGLVIGNNTNSKILGFSSLKGDFLVQEVGKLLENYNGLPKTKNREINTDYHFGGYAKKNQSLIDFINNFRLTYQIEIEPIYTGKLAFGVFDLIKKGYFPVNSKILLIHTGGLRPI